VANAVGSWSMASPVRPLEVSTSMRNTEVRDSTTNFNDTEPPELLNVAVPRPSGPMVYVPVKVTVEKLPEGARESSLPWTMLPFPSAWKLPTVGTGVDTVSLEKAYWPFKLALENTISMVAELDLLESAADVAVTTTEPPAGGVAGAV
jgi:hypothetical protein